MLSGTFASKIRKLNQNLRIFCGDDPKRAATLYFSKFNMGWEINPEDYVEICAVDKNYLPEDPVTDGKCHLVKGGWRRVINMLIARKLVNKQKAERLFNTRFNRAAVTANDLVNDPVQSALRDAQERGRGPTEADGVRGTHYRTDDMMDIAAMIRKQKNQRTSV